MLGKTVLNVNHNLGLNNKVQLAVRPEHITYVSKNETRCKDRFNYLSGKVTKISFTGSGARFFIECDDGIQLMMDNLSPNKESLNIINTQVDIKFPIDSIMVFDSLSGNILLKG